MKTLYNADFHKIQNSYPVVVNEIIVNWENFYRLHILKDRIGTPDHCHSCIFLPNVTTCHNLLSNIPKECT